MAITGIWASFIVACVRSGADRLESCAIFKLLKSSFFGHLIVSWTPVILDEVESEVEVNMLTSGPKYFG